MDSSFRIDFTVDFARQIDNRIVVNHLNAAFAALSDPTRRKVIDRLRRGPASVGELSRPFRISQQALSRHIATLEAARLIDKEKVGREQICRLRPDAIRKVSDWAENFRAFWEDRYDRLDEVLVELKSVDSSRKEKEHG